DMYKQSRTEGFGEEVKRRLLFGTTVLTGERNETYFRQAQKVRTLIGNDFKAAFEQYDVIIGPTTPTAAFKFDDVMDPLTSYMNAMLTVHANLACLPALSAPSCYTDRVLPLSLQLIRKHFSEEILYRVAYTFEQSTNQRDKRPSNGGTQQ